MLLATCLLFLAGCGENNKYSGGSTMNSNEKDVLALNKQIILEKVKADEEIIEGTAGKLVNSGVAQIKELSVDEEASWGWVLSLTDLNEQSYYVELDRYGCLSILRKDSSEGEIVLAFVDDLLI